MKIITNPVEAADALKRHQIPTHLWTGGNTNTVALLMQSLEKDLIQLEENDHANGPSLILRINVVVLHVQVYWKDMWLQLFEDNIYCPKTGQRKSRHSTFNGSVAGKPRRNESVQNKNNIVAAARRELGEELGQTEPRFKDISCFDLVPRFCETTIKMDWYPGLPEHFNRYHHRCLIHPDLFHIKYTEVDEDHGRILTFRWKVMENQEEPEDEIIPTPGSTVFDFPA